MPPIEVKTTKNRNFYNEKQNIVGIVLVTCAILYKERVLGTVLVTCAILYKKVYFISNAN